MIDGDIRAAIVELRRIQREIDPVVETAEAGWRLQLALLRRQLSGVIADAFQRVSGPLSKPHLEALRTALSGLRARLAYHPARAPAVSIEVDDPLFAASVAKIDATFATFAELEAVLYELDRASEKPCPNGVKSS